MQRIGLYYPYVHVRDERWLKAAALYLPGLARVVPIGFLLNDSETVRTLRGIDFLVDAEPREAAAAVAPLFVEAVRGNEGELRNRYTPAINGDYGTMIVNSEPTAPGEQPLQRRPLAGFHRGEFAPGLAEFLADEHLVHPRPRGAGHGQDPANWIAMDPAFAWVYKCVLTAELAKRTAYVPVTDQVVAHGTAEDWTSDRIAAALLGREPLPLAPDAQMRLGLMSVQCVLPGNLRAVPIDKIIKLRRDYAAEFTAFAEGVQKTAAELREVTANVTDRAAYERYLQATFDENIAKPLNDLRDAMTGLNLKTVVSAFNIKNETPAAATFAGGMAGGNTTVAVAGLAVAAATWRYGVGRERDSALGDSPVGYLLRTERNLKPATLVNRVKRAVGRAVGSGI